MSASAGTLLVVEADARGHHLYYARLLLEAATREGRRAILWTTPDVVRTEEFRVHLGSLSQDRFAIAPVRGSDPDTARLRLMRRALDAHPAGATVVVTHADRLLVRLWLASRRHTFDARLLLMRSPFAHGTAVSQRLRRALKRAALRLVLSQPSVTVAVLGGPWPASEMRVGGRRVRILPDPPLLLSPLPTVAEARARLRLPDGMVFLLIGRLDVRKGVPEALSAWQQRKVRTGHLCLVGSVADGLLPTIQSAIASDGRIILREGYVSDDDFLAYIRASDVVITAYHNSGPSGVYAAARAVGTPVIAAGNEEIIAAVEGEGGGIVCQLSPRAMAGALDRAARAGLPEQPSGDGRALDARARFTGYFLGA